MQRTRFEYLAFQIQVKKSVSATQTCSVCFLCFRIIENSDPLTKAQFFCTSQTEQCAFGLQLVGTRPVANGLRLFVRGRKVYSLCFEVLAWNKPNCHGHCNYLTLTLLQFKQKQPISPNRCTLSSEYLQLEDYSFVFGRYRVLIPSDRPLLASSDITYFFYLFSDPFSSSDCVPSDD